MIRFRQPAAGSCLFRLGQEPNLVEEIINRFLVVFGEPGSELISVFTVTVYVAGTRLDGLLNSG
jgi:hypothetical protein